MRDEHLDTVPATESDEVIKSSVEDLVLIPSEFEGIPNTICDVYLVNNPTPLEAKDHFEIVINSNDDISSSDDDSLYKENIEDKKELALASSKSRKSLSPNGVSVGEVVETIGSSEGVGLPLATDMKLTVSVRLRSTNGSFNGLNNGLRIWYLIFNLDSQRLDVFSAFVISRRHRVLCHLGFTFYYFRMRRGSRNRGSFSQLAVEESRLDVPELGILGLDKLVLDKLEAGLDHD
nr:hypothetical protein [Tanacetum cinerariifolium]